MTGRWRKGQSPGYRVVVSSLSVRHNERLDSSCRLRLDDTLAYRLRVDITAPAGCDGQHSVEGDSCPTTTTSASCGTRSNTTLYQATASLLFLLQGMETVRARELTPYNALPAVQKTYAACFAKIAYLGVPLSMSGPNSDPNCILRREGEAEQLAFKGWVEQVYNCVWDARYRKPPQDDV